MIIVIASGGAELKTDKLFKELEKMGCHVDEALERVVNDKEFYVDCLNAVVEDPCFDELEANLKAGNLSAAFDSAHTLKGVLANLSLTPLYEITERIVEPLRAGRIEGLLPVYEELTECRESFKKILRSE